MPHQTNVIFMAMFLATVCSSYMLDQHNYFYINTSYTRQTISLSLCLQLNQTAIIAVESTVLVPQGNHRFSGIIKDHKPIQFDNPYDQQFIGYNSYDEGEYWFGVKIPYGNPNGYRFLTLKMNLTVGQNIHHFILLQPLFTFPLSGLQVGPYNSLRMCGLQVLVSVNERFGQFDVTMFGPKGSKFNIAQKKTWGYFKEDSDANYLRFKGKRHNQITAALESSLKTTTCLFSKQDLMQFVKFPTEKEGYSLQELVISTTGSDKGQQL